MLLPLKLYEVYDINPHHFRVYEVPGDEGENWLAPFAKWCIRHVQAIVGSGARPGFRRGRWRRRRPQTEGCFCAFQEAVAWCTASSISCQHSKRRPLRARDLSVFPQGSIPFKGTASVGWKTYSPRGDARLKSKTATARCMVRLSSTASTRSTS
jgi:hypothetical protein